MDRTNRRGSVQTPGRCEKHEGLGHVARAGIWTMVCSELVACQSPWGPVGLSISISQDSWTCLKDHMPVLPGAPLEGWASWA